MRAFVHGLQSRMNRRRLLKLASLAGVTPGLWISARASIAGQDDPSESPKSAQEEVVENEPGETEVSEEARTLGEMANKRYGEHLEDGVHEELVKDLNYGVQGGEKLRQVKLTNADEPDFVFHVD